MAHITQVIGKCSELTAMLALYANGWQVSEPPLDEVYDIVARHPQITQNRWVTLQVKTARIRQERDNAIVISAKKSSGESYSREECDYIIGVTDDAAYLIENTGQGEYWAKPANIDDKWTKLATDIRNLSGNTEEEAV